eukprot:5904556-Pleurochrysis_carterae.AAC.1
MEGKEVTFKRDRAHKIGYTHSDWLHVNKRSHENQKPEVSSRPSLLFDAFWKRDDELPPFTVDNEAAVEFLRALEPCRRQCGD